MNNEELAAQVSALDIQPGNFVLLRVAQGVMPDSIQPLVDQVQWFLPAGTTVAVLVGDTDISTLSDEQMRNAGWVRKSVVDELVDAIEPVIAISDRKHDAWDRAKEVIASIKGGA